jgi:multisubunit Na+/H+ antiporter MnhC subunit
MSLQAALAIIVGTVSAVGLWLLLQRSMFQVVLGVGMLGHATNLFIFAVGGLTRLAPPFAGPHVYQGALWADPLPQALILTAIVIGMGLQLFLVGLLVLVNKARAPKRPESSPTTDTGDIEDTDQLGTSRLNADFSSPSAEGTR